MKAENSQLKKGIALNYINMGIGNLIPIFYTPVMLSLLGQSEYGLYKLSSSVTSYLSLISLGIGSAVTRYLIKYRTEGDKEGEEKILGLFMTIFRLVAIVALVVGTWLTLNLDIWYGDSLSAEQLSRMRTIVFLMVCNTAISFAASPYVSVVNAHEKFVFQQCMNILLTCVAPILNLIVLFMGFASVGMAVSSLAVNVFAQFIYYLYVRNSLHINACYKGMPINLLKEILKFSFWIFVSNVVLQLNKATDTVIIGSVPELSTVGVAVYNIGATFDTIVSNLTTGISALLSPKTNRLVFEGKNNEELTDFAIYIGRIQCYIAALVIFGFIAFGRPFIQFYAGEGYEEAYIVALLLMIPNMIPLLQSICLNIVVAKNRHRFRSLLYSAITALNVFGTWVLVHSMGVVGAALMSAITQLGGQIVLNWYYWKKIGLNIPRFWQKIIPILIIPSVLTVIVLILSFIVDFYNWVVMFVGIVIYAILYCVGNWCIVMDYNEKKLIMEQINNFRERLKR